ncbi:nucleotide exchange factor GrpE [Nocardioides sp. AE5]|uniref:nucleotide exchange factor GrpE n=1 Tax=Nocardioides sp. AE5 TaxID=2962573 RepID=UPI00288181F7|nr:nucleotide exchange factor GrpE [Nocardioides sp. AE5]MDT0200327.1 nucleotide exchange factor GrpE [Nocardioides sp. AE5]
MTDTPQGPTPEEPEHGTEPATGEEDAVEQAASSSPEGEQAAEASAEADELTVARMERDELKLDLQRVQAEYLNYKRRVERDRPVQVENTTYKVLTPIIEVLDTIDRAREHGPLEDGLRAVADQLKNAVASQGLIRFGEPGEPFDPNLHDALSHMGEDPDVEVTTIKVVAKGGYRIGERVVRAAQVLVVDPATEASAPEA